jgi:cytochrome P450
MRSNDQAQSVSTMSTFFLAMTLYPDVQLKAREEIDRVVGSKRLPNLEDRARLPYVEAVVKECFRWHPIAPMGLPHVSTVDDICADYFIPKGALILPNIWYGTQRSSLIRTYSGNC